MTKLKYFIAIIEKAGDILSLPTKEQEICMAIMLEATMLNRKDGKFSRVKLTNKVHTRYEIPRETIEVGIDTLVNVGLLYTVSRGRLRTTL